MKAILTLVGRLVFWAAWPGLYLYLRNTRRTRVLVICGDELLVVKHWLGRDFWQLPGGGLYKQEDVLHGAARELQEETGVLVVPSQLDHLKAEKTTVVGIPLVHEYVLLQVDEKPVIKKQRIEIRATAWLAITDSSVQSSRGLRAALKAHTQYRGKSGTI